MPYFSTKNFVKQLHISLAKGAVRPVTIGVIVLLSLAVTLLDCGGGSGGSKPQESQPSTSKVGEPQREPYAEIIQQGIAKYLGLYSPMSAESKGGSTTHSFGGGDGPLCLYGSVYNISTRDLGAENLIIFLQSGGACWSDICSCRSFANPEIPKRGILDPDLPDNPLKGWNTVFLPSCDGSHFSGDIDLDLDDDGVIDRYQRGLKNLSAGLDVAANLFPAPRRIVIAGISAGGYGTAYALPLVRYLYPDTPIYIINDSGVGILPPGAIEKILYEWNAMAFLPKSCIDCLDENGHLTNYYAWLLSQDKNLRMGMMSYKRDTVIADVFSDMGGEFFEEQLMAEMAELEGKHPGRVCSFVAAGESHTFLLGDLDVTAGGMSVVDWVAAMLDQSPECTSVAD